LTLTDATESIKNFIQQTNYLSARDEGQLSDSNTRFTPIRKGFVSIQKYLSTSLSINYIIMKKKALILLLVVLSQNSIAKQLTDNQKLISTCKVWGFLKYYHPRVANGEFDWDNQLIKILPQIYKAQTETEFSLVIENWIDKLGEIKTIAPIAPLKEIRYFDKNFDLSWIQSDKLFSKRLSQKLIFIECNRFQTKEEYGPDFDVFKNGKYFDLDYNDKNSRILMLFMYWNLIEYYFPYKYLMDEKWNKSLDKILPLVINSQNKEDFYKAMKKLSTGLNDSHVEFVEYKSSTKNLKYFPANCKIIEEKLIVTEILGDSLAQAYDIKTGDIITKINGKSIKDYISENREIICASNEAAYLDKVVKPILRSYDENVKVEFLINGKYEEKLMTWFNYHDSHRNEFKKGAMKKKEKFKLLDENIGYVNMGVLRVKNVPEMIDSLKNTKAIIFDMRNYPRETYAEIANFLNSEEKKFAIYTLPDLNYPGRFIWSNGTMCGHDNKENYKGKVIVLLNEDSMSQSEWTAMCFQTAANTTIIGSQTAGADGNVVELDFKGFHTRYSGIGVYYPDGKETQRIGIVPDIEVKPTIKGIQQGKDEVLDRAIQFIKNGK